MGSIGRSCLYSVLIVVAACMIWKKLSKPNMLRGKAVTPAKKLLPGGCQRITIKEIISATNNLNELNGQGTAGKVYKGVLSGRQIAVKHIVNEANVETFVREVTSLSHVKHPNLVSLLGYCDEEDECFLVYELCPNETVEGLKGEMINLEVKKWDLAQVRKPINEDKVKELKEGVDLLSQVDQLATSEDSEASSNIGKKLGVKQDVVEVRLGQKQQVEMVIETNNKGKGGENGKEAESLLEEGEYNLSCSKESQARSPKPSSVGIKRGSDSIEVQKRGEDHVRNREDEDNAKEPGEGAGSSNQVEGFPTSTLAKTPIGVYNSCGKEVAFLEEGGFGGEKETRSQQSRVDRLILDGKPSNIHNKEINLLVQTEVSRRMFDQTMLGKGKNHPCSKQDESTMSKDELKEFNYLKGKEVKEKFMNDQVFRKNWMDRENKFVSEMRAASEVDEKSLKGGLLEEVKSTATTRKVSQVRSPRLSTEQSKMVTGYCGSSSEARSFLTAEELPELKNITTQKIRDKFSLDAGYRRDWMERNVILDTASSFGGSGICDSEDDDDDGFNENYVYVNCDSETLSHALSLGRGRKRFRSRKSKDNHRHWG